MFRTCRHVSFGMLMLECLFYVDVLRRKDLIIIRSSTWYIFQHINMFFEIWVPNLICVFNMSINIVHDHIVNL